MIEQIVSLPPVDGNFDGIPDSEQDNVVSVLSANSGYVTFAAPEGQPLANVQLIPNPDTGNILPANVDFSLGFFEFTVTQVAPYIPTTVVTVFLPQGTTANNYWNYRASYPEWYNFTFSPITNTGATFQDVNGDGQNEIILHFFDGQRGDNTGCCSFPDGQITAVGAPAFSTNTNTPPIANDDNVITDEDNSVTFNILANDIDADGDSLSLYFPTVWYDIYYPDNGTLDAYYDGTLTYTPNPNFNGTDTFRYGVTDGTDTTTGIVTITVNPVNDPPTLPYPIGEVYVRPNERFSYTLPETVLIDVDGDTLDLFFMTSTAPYAWIEYDALSGTISGGSSYEGTHTVYGIAIDSGGLDSGFVPFYIHVSYAYHPPNQPPTISDIFKSGDEDTVINFSETDFTSAFYDPDYDPYYFSYDSLQKIQILDLPHRGILQLNGGNVALNQEISYYELNSLTYTPDANVSSSYDYSDGFVWTGSDGDLYADSPAAVGFYVYPVNDPPVVTINKGLTLEEGNSNTIYYYDLQVTDVDNTTAEISYTLTDLPDNGTLLLYGTALATNSNFTQEHIDNGWLTYQHDGSETISDSFSFTVSDGAGGEIENSYFYIGINPVNDAPTLQQEIADQTAIENQPFNFTIPETTFSDIDGDSLNYSLAEGTVLPAGITFDTVTGTFSGTPTAAGTYNLTVVAADAANATASDTFSLQIFHPVAVPPGGGVIPGTSQDDIVDASGKTGTYRLESGAGNDLLIGSNQRDVLKGGAGNDRLYGGGDIDKLFGEEGDDLLNGGAGLDYLDGGAGADSFVLAVGNGSERIIGFNPNEGDLFALSGLSFGQLSFNSNQILSGSEMLAQVTDNLGNPVTGFDTHPEWFVTI